MQLYKASGYVLLVLSISSGALAAGLVVREIVSDNAPQDIKALSNSINFIEWTPSSNALPPSRFWQCNGLLDEYRTFLEAGNAAADWKYAGAEYVYAENTDEQEFYNWEDFLTWARENGCNNPVIGTDEFAALPSGLGAAIAGGSGAAAAGTIAAVSGNEQNSSSNESPPRLLDPVTRDPIDIINDPDFVLPPLRNDSPG